MSGIERVAAVALRVARTHPCYLSVECMHPRHHHTLPRSRSLVLTLDTGYE